MYYYYFFLGFLWDDQPEVRQFAPESKNSYLRDLEDEDELYLSGGVSNHHTDVTNGNATSGRITSSQTKKNVPLKYRKYDLDQDVKTWSDFKRLHYHPKSCLVINDHSYNSSNDSFNAWVSGKLLSRNESFFMQFEDTVRFYAEECDHMQGFNLLTDINNGFGGLSSGFLDYLSDEYHGKTVAAFPCLESLSRSLDSSQFKTSTLSTLLTLSSAIESASFVSPLSLCERLFELKPHKRRFPNVAFDANLPYHTAAILAAIYETAMSPCRTPGMNLATMANDLVNGGRSVLELSGALPVPYYHDRYKTFSDMIDEWSHFEPFISFTPSTKSNSTLQYLSHMQEETDEHCTSVSANIRGFPLASIPGSSKANSEIPDQLQSYFQHKFSGCSTYATAQRDPLKILAPFPHIFTNRISTDGTIASRDYSDVNHHGERPDSPCSSSSSSMSSPRSPRQTFDTGMSLPAMSCFKNSSNLVHLLRECYKHCDSLKPWVSRARHSDFAVEADALEEAAERFRTLKEEYEFLSFNDSDEESDDDSD